MNIQGTINKVLLGIEAKGKQVKYETKTFYSPKLSRYMTIYTLYDKQFVSGKDGESILRWINLWQGYNKVHLLQKLVSYYKAGETNDKV